MVGESLGCLGESNYTTVWWESYGQNACDRNNFAARPMTLETVNGRKRLRLIKIRVCRSQPRRSLVFSSPRNRSLGWKRSPIKIFFVVGWTVNLSSKVDHQEMGGE